MAAPVTRDAAVTRDVRIDALKGLAIVCVVLYHTMGQFLITAPGLALYLREFVFSFMLPLFAFLSGYVLGRPGRFRPRQYFVRRTLGLMVPYVCWEFIYGLLSRQGAERRVDVVGTYFSGIFSNPHFEGRMWYLYVLWIALMMVGVLRLCGDRSWVLAASIVLVVAWPWWGTFNRLQWIYGFVVFGLLARRYESVYLPRIRAIGVVGALVYAPLWLASRPEKFAVARVEALLQGTAWVRAGVSGVYWVSTIVGLAAVAALVGLSFVVPARIEAPLAVAGRLSLGIYVTHFMFVELWHDPSPWLIPVIVGLALGLSMLATLILGRWRVSATLLLGERWTSRSQPLGDIETETI